MVGGAGRGLCRLALRSAFPLMPSCLAVGGGLALARLHRGLALLLLALLLALRRIVGKRLLSCPGYCARSLNGGSKGRVRR